ncbi:MAG: hypothetical protein GX936_10045 [Clostridiales bacterium]|jgi:hypothetical protein|nr:hypothetical protein [Clostridiales bacterium]
MFTQYFGNYLIESGIISAEQFKEALQQIKDKRAKLGVLAIEAGYMTPAQVEEAVSMQKRVDRKFGEIALIKGYMTDFELERLLARQSSRFSVFSQILIDSGYMTYSELSEHLENYKKRCGLSAVDFEKLQAGDIGPVIEKNLPGPPGDPWKNAVIRNYTELFIRNIMRFVNDRVTLGEAPDGRDCWIVCQRMDGPRRLIPSFSGGEDVMRYFACWFAKADYLDFNLVRDILGEFINCVNGLFASSALESGVKLEPGPQQVTNDPDAARTDDMFSIGFFIENHPYRLSLAF